jgi:hypothetical protein
MDSFNLGDRAIQEWLRLHLSSTAVYKEFSSINQGRFVRGKKERSIRKFLRFVHTYRGLRIR